MKEFSGLPNCALGTKLTQALTTDSSDMTNSDINIPDKVLKTAAIKEGLF